MADLTRFARDQARERAEKSLAADLQQVIRRHINRQRYTILELSRLLDLEVWTIQSFMQQPTWQLGFCLEIIGLLQIPTRTTGSRTRQSHDSKS